MRQRGQSQLRRGQRSGKEPEHVGLWEGEHGGCPAGMLGGQRHLSPFPSRGPEPRASLGVSLPVPAADLYCTLEVDSFGYFVSKAKTRVFRDTTEPKWDEVSGGGWRPRRDL